MAQAILIEPQEHKAHANAIHAQLQRIWRMKEAVNRYYGIDYRTLRRSSSSWHDLYCHCNLTIQQLSREHNQTRDQIENDIARARRELELTPHRDLDVLVDMVNQICMFVVEQLPPVRTVIMLRIADMPWSHIKIMVPTRDVMSMMDDYRDFLRRVQYLPAWDYLRRKR